MYNRDFSNRKLQLKIELHFFFNKNIKLKEYMNINLPLHCHESHPGTKDFLHQIQVFHLLEQFLVVLTMAASYDADKPKPIHLSMDSIVDVDALEKIY